MKKWILSKTLWFNALAAALAYVMSSAQAAPIDPMWQTILIAGGNFGLRWLTRSKLTL